MHRIKIIESPRDAMQGLVHFIPTKDKARYINTLLKVGFDTIDFGSFVSPKAIPQLKDTAAVLEKLDLSKTKTKLYKYFYPTIYDVQVENPDGQFAIEQFALTVEE